MRSDPRPARGFVEGLARLLADGALRARFVADAGAVLDALGVGGDDRAALLALDRTELAKQGAALVDKRFHEVARLLPHTTARLGARAAPLFAEHAAAYWPEGHRRHEDDALAFHAFLRRGGVRVATGEAAALEVARGRRRFAVTFRYDFPVRGVRRPALVATCRLAGRVRVFSLYLRWFRAAQLPHDSLQR